MTAYLSIDCADAEQARAWGDKIVATLEDQDGNPIPADAVDDFEAECNPDETTVELLDDNV